MSRPDKDSVQYADLKHAVETLDAAKAVHLKLLRGEPLKDTDRMVILRLIRLLVAEWV